MGEQTEKIVKVTPFYHDNVLTAPHDVVIQLGGRFSGKSQNDQVRLTGNLANKKNYKLLVIEDLETGMADGFYAGLRDRIEEFEHEPAYNPRSRNAYIKNNINGNVALFKGFKSEQQKSNVKKLSGITEIVVEEGDWVTYQDLMAFLQQLRGGDEEDRKVTILMNPVNPDCYVNQELILKPADIVYEYFPGTKRPKVFQRNMRVTLKDEDGKDYEKIISILVVISVHWDNPYLNDLQRASVESMKDTDPDGYEQLAKAKFIYPKGALLSSRNYYSLKRLDLSQAARITAIIDTASSGTNSATLGIYAEYDEEHHYLIDALKDADDAKKVIPRFITMINKWKPQKVMIEKNHEGLYYESEVKKGVPKSILVEKFHSSENKHEKILGQSGRMINHLYIRDDGSQEYDMFISEAYGYNRDKRKNKVDDCIDNMAMYFKHGDTGTWGWRKK